MQTLSQTSFVPKKLLWAGWIISALAVLFLAFDAIIKIIQHPEAMTATAQLGYAENLVFGIGLLELVCLVIYIISPTSVLGAILLTGYLGGAVATHVRAGSDLFSMLFPVIIGAMVWGGLWLRDNRLQTFIPWRR
ncbi:MAG: DoxX family protein [Anaerolineae bacterium]|nr:DoxX family protein [Anaerolineae bacterium]